MEIIREKKTWSIAVALLIVAVLTIPAWAEDDARLARKLQGPTATLPNSPPQYNGDFGIGAFPLLASLSDPLSAFHADSPAVSSGRIIVMTRNLYAGASFSTMLGASTLDDVGERAVRIYARILSSQFPRRAEAIADEIVRTRPDVVGLQ